MADILIRGMEMPKDGAYWCEIGVAGKIATITIHGEDRKAFPIVPLPKKHGRLIDADAFKAMCLSATKEAKPDFIRHEDWLKSCAITTAFCRDIDEQPTIVPAEGVTDDVQKQ